MSASFNPSNAAFSSVSHFHGYSFRNRLCNGAAMVAKCLTNLALKLHRPRNVCSSLTVVGTGHLVIASFFYGSIDMVEFSQCG